ncbi:MAG: hypothetical protein ACOC3W_09240 [Thermodesulfobacteriota bacterium]
MRFNWFPWRFIIRRIARSHGLLDPVLLLSQLNKFAQPSEVAAPVELIRASLVLHARGLLNARTIQTNLDWIWPFWVQRQFDPMDAAFVPRSYTLTNVNLSHRNWTAVGLPDCDSFPIVDPRGMVTPFFDGWSLDGWIVGEDGAELLPCRVDEAGQQVMYAQDRWVVETRVLQNGLRLKTVAQVVVEEKKVLCRLSYQAVSDRPAVFVAALRPCNPEGISFIHDISVSDDHRTWCVNRNRCITLDPPMERHCVSAFHEGDVHRNLMDGEDKPAVQCRVGMASAAALYDLKPNHPLSLTVDIDLSRDSEIPELFPAGGPVPWSDALAGLCRLSIPDAKIQFLYDVALRSIILHSPLDVYPGPFYYKRFWFRDAVYILQAMICTGMMDRAERLIDRFPGRQGMDGYFHSQKGEWDSNGQVMWIMRLFTDVTGRPLKPEWKQAVVRAGKWIQRKRLSSDLEAPHAGLLPAGFSAEHLGHNDYYYWDDFWSVAGLYAGAALLDREGDETNGSLFRKEADDLMACIDRSLEKTRALRRHDGIPAAPERRMDSGAIGSVVAGYPLQLWAPDDPRLCGTLEFLLEHCFVQNGFFQDIFHSGYNMYLSLHCAQVLLRAGDDRYLPIIGRVVELASPTGQWPEAIHPHTLGGCQGDGQHIWAAAEWVMMLRNMFVREEEDRLVLLQGIPEKWLDSGEEIVFGPVHTAFGTLRIRLFPEEAESALYWDAQWRKDPPILDICLPGFEKRAVNGGEARSVSLIRTGPQSRY